MKQLLILLLAISFLGCQQEPEKPKDYVTIAGKIINMNSDSIQVRSRTFSKTIKVNPDGTFKDTLKVDDGLYNFYDGSESASVFLKNGYDLNITLDTKEFDETIKFAGEGAISNNFLAEKSLFEEKLFESFDNIDETNLDATFENAKTKLSEFYNSNKEVDSMITNNMNSDLEPMLNAYKGYFAEKIAFKKQFPAGTSSPTFENYENFKGGTMSLADLKGKYVYIDVWATWCGPCKAEIPSLKKVEAQYHDKNIEFVSISADNGRGYKAASQEAAAIAAKEGWKAMITDKEMGGIQLFADKAFESDFLTAYKINSIPRFILIDPKGNIVDADAPRPSDPKLIKLFNDLKI
jgi:thiol-disulfide isomerase/thioredoxin